MLFEEQAGEETDSSDLQCVTKGMLRTFLRPDRCAVYVCGHSGTVDDVQRLISLRDFKLDIDLKREK